MNTERYSSPAIAAHWLIALLIFAAFPLGLYMHELPLSPTKLKLYSYHKWIGITVLLLAVGAWVAWQVRTLEGSGQTVQPARQPRELERRESDRSCPDDEEMLTSNRRGPVHCVATDRERFDKRQLLK